MNALARILIGGLGGLTAALSKILALDVSRLGALIKSGNIAQGDDLLVTIYIFTPVLIILGAIVGWASNEKHRVKLLAIGCAAPALLAPWTAGELSTATSLVASLSPVSSAQAQSSPAEPQSDFAKGLEVLLGLDDPKKQKYWVVIRSDDDFARARAFAEAVNENAPELEAFVGSRAPDNPYYPVIVGGPDAYLPYEEANALLLQARELYLVSDAYLSAYPDRTPLEAPQ